MRKILLVFAAFTMFLATACDPEAKENKDNIPVNSVVLNKFELILEPGQSEMLVASVKPDNATDKTVIWSSSDENVASVNSEGKVEAKKEGTAIITAKAGEKEDKCKVLVQSSTVAVSSVVLDKTEIELEIGGSEQLTATVLPEDATDKTVHWSCSNTSVATVSDGVVTAVSAGECDVMAKVEDKEAHCKVTVKAKADEYTVTMSKTELSIVVGQEFQLKRTVTPEVVNVTSVWTSSNPAVATVTKGKVTGVSAGQVTITVDVLGYTAKCEVTVNEYNKDEAVDLGLSVKWRGWNLGATKPEEYGYYYAWGETEQKTEYNSSNYKWMDPESELLTKYNDSTCAFGDPDNKLHMDLEDDAAHVLLGGGWRLPTKAEASELRDNCDFELATLYGVRGFMFTSRKNGNYIFLPGAGMKIDDHLSLDDSRFGRYWTSDLNADYGYAYFFGFEISAFNQTQNAFTDGWYRVYGMTIRPVTE